MTRPAVTCRIALAGYARVGKDTVGDILVREYGLRRVAFGDLIKYQLDPLIREHLGFSAFTQDDEQKRRIREVLVHWGYANQDAIERDFFSALPARCVNTRIFRLRECKRWIKQGGVVWEVTRPGYRPAEPREDAELEAAREEGLIAHHITNAGTVSDLAARVQDAFLLCGLE